MVLGGVLGSLLENFGKIREKIGIFGKFWEKVWENLGIFWKMLEILGKFGENFGNFEKKQQKVKFVEDIIKRQQEFKENENDVLLIKKTELKV